MNKEEFIQLVSKKSLTNEDEFRAMYNSPELIWERVISKLQSKPTELKEVLKNLESINTRKLPEEDRILIIDARLKLANYLN